MTRLLPGDVRAAEITPESVYLNRRAFLKSMGILAAAAAFPRLATAKGVFDAEDSATPYDDITHYNNYYEFGTDKTDPAANAGAFKTRPWKVVVDGECAKPKIYDIDDLLKRFPQEERIYRHRCVEAWSMVMPWTGFPLAALLKRAEPTRKAKFVAFTSVHDPAQMPGQKTDVLEWPYVEGLRLDEAMHPLALLVTGLYGKPLPNQDGAPLRLAVPWKYGFKSLKAIVHIRLVEKQPKTTWNASAPSEYGFYSNVNPEIDHPRWSQAKERRIGELFKRKTLLFNGYGAQVAGLYKEMDLRANF